MAIFEKMPPQFSPEFIRRTLRGMVERISGIPAFKMNERRWYQFRCLAKRLVSKWCRPKRIRPLFYPSLPVSESVIYKLCYLLGVEMTNLPFVSCRLAVHWDDTTFRNHDEVLDRLA